MTPHELRSSGKVRRVVAGRGESFIITQNGVPSAELRHFPKRPTSATREEFSVSTASLPHRSGRYEELRRDREENTDTRVRL